MAAAVICMSRAIFAGADEVATRVGEALGFRCVDEEIISLAAERRKLDPQDVASAEQRKSFFARLFEDMDLGAGMAGLAGYGTGYVPDPSMTPPRSDSLRALIREAVMETAQQGRVLIVAHAASYALAHRTDVLRVLVTGSSARRAQRLANSTGVPQEAAAAGIRDSDVARADYLKRFYKVDCELAEHYDLCISTDAFTPAQAAEQIVNAARTLQR